ncbi:hypothetical protein Trydic_g18335 [Trypoxylus dichotomus]
MFSDDKKTNRMSALLQHVSRYQQEGKSLTENIIGGFMYSLQKQKKEIKKLFARKTTPYSDISKAWERYSEILQKLRTAIRGKELRRLHEGVQFLHDGARPHMSDQTMFDTAKLGGPATSFVSPDIAPPDLYLFEPL